MGKISYKIVFLFIYLLVLVPPKSFSTQKVKTIVVFFSLNESMPAYQSFLQGFNTALPEFYKEPCNILIEYLDVGRGAGLDNLKRIAGIYNEKFNNDNLDLIVTFGPDTYPLLKEAGLKILETIPTIVIDIDKKNGPIEQKQAGNILKINVKYDFGKTFRNAFELFPESRNIYIFGGSSAVDKYHMNLVLQAVQPFQAKYKFSLIAGIALDSILQILPNIPENSLVFVPSFSSDSKNIPYSTILAISYIYRNCNSPFFTFSDSFIKGGGLGGYVYSFTDLGKEAGKVAGEILLGKPLNSITIEEDGFYRYIYDWQQLKRWKIRNSAAIPSNSRYINKDIDFYSQYRYFIYALLLFIFIQMLLILYLYKLNERKKDIARDKAEVEKLYRALLREDRLSKMTELTASISHELNQPLTAILYNAQAGLRFQHMEKSDTIHTSEIFENIIEDSKRAGALLISIRNLMKVESREMEAVSIHTLIEETQNIFNNEAIHHHITLKLRMEEQPVFVFGAKIQLQQVLINFLLNALYAMDNLNSDDKSIEIGQKTDGDSVIVSVQDTGSGIDFDMFPKIFDPFVTTRKGGFGMGLSICRSIIDKHKGKIWAENIDGGGAKFSFRLQIMRNEQQG